MKNNKGLAMLFKTPPSIFAFKQQVKKRLLGPERPMRILFGIARGIWLILDPMHKTQFILGLAEAEISRDFKKFTLWSGTFFDIGAASGYFSLIYRKWNKKGEMYLFEPDPVFQEVQQNYFTMNNFRVDFHQYLNFVGESESENTLTIDSFVEKHNLRGRRLFFKIDVDGGEMDVLKGAVKTLAHSECRLIIETHSLQLEKDCISVLQSGGYDVRIIRNAWWRFIIKEIRPIEHNRWLSAKKMS